MPDNLFLALVLVPGEYGTKRQLIAGKVVL